MLNHNIQNTKDDDYVEGEREKAFKKFMEIDFSQPSLIRKINIYF